MTTPSSVENIFLAALELESPGACAAFLDQACACDADLRQRVERLLRAHAKASNCPEWPAAGNEPTTVSPTQQLGATRGAVGAKPVLPLGSTIGPYQLIQKLGEGGMGIVYVAQQERPVKRRLAIKVIKPGMDSARIMRRFEAERQALALLDHPNIAKVLDAGTTESEHPYFAMELVRGVPINRYCDELRTPIQERLELFVQVCSAIHHAHQKGIIHRDIKPSNVLVRLQDDKPVPMVIDFGVAKSLHQNLSERNEVTEFGAMVGTLEYMAPEQAGPNMVDIDTRADVYSLGVLLYELLTGTTPFDVKRLRAAAVTDVIRIIKGEAPLKPSTRLTQVDQSISTLAAQRRTEPAQLAVELRGELDWIVMKALEKDRTRRYDSASALADDVMRHLRREPVLACPPSTSYRVRKFVLRHRIGVAATILCLGILVAGVIVSTCQAIRATGAEREARASWHRVEQERERALAAEGKAEHAATETQAVLDFMDKQLFRQEGQDGGTRKGITVLKAIDAAEPQVALAFKSQPLVEARVRGLIGETYRSLGEPALAIPQLERARELRIRLLGADHPDTLSTQNDLAIAYTDFGQIARGIALHQQTLASQTARLGPDDPETLHSQRDLAVAFRNAGRLDDAIQLYQNTLAAQMRLLGPDNPDTLTTQVNLAVAFRCAGRLQEAVDLSERTVAAELARYGPNNLATLGCQHNLAVAYVAIGRLDKAIPLMEAILPTQKRELCPDHLLTLRTQNALARAYDEMGDDARPEPLFRDTLERRKRKLDPRNPSIAVTQTDLGRHLLRRKKYAEAEPFLRDGLAIRAAIHPDDWQTLESRGLLGVSLLGQKKYSEAESHVASSLTGLKARMARIPADGKTRILKLIERVAQLYEDAGKESEARRWQQELDTLQPLQAVARPSRNGDR